jgi:hypothetical protein
MNFYKYVLSCSSCSHILCLQLLCLKIVHDFRKMERLSNAQIDDDLIYMVDQYMLANARNDIINIYVCKLPPSVSHGFVVSITLSITGLVTRMFLDEFILIF